MTVRNPTGTGESSLETARKPTFERKVTIERAELALHRLVNSHFNNNRETHPHARMTIPANQDDDDLVLSDFIAQSAMNAQEREPLELLRECVSTLEAIRYAGFCDVPSNLEKRIERLLAERGEGR